ncbi:MAG: matrixin family metalloprotease [Parcubacteria group bacterium]|nr:matrixin family metalloprotease [Parcubacteria group bacterium]
MKIYTQKSIRRQSHKIITAVFSAVLIIGLVFYFENDLKLARKNLSEIISPCARPLEYSLGDFDKRFGLSREDFLSAVSQAAEIWQKPAGKKLFNQAAGGALKINLIYDSRQAATDKLKKLGFSIHNNQATYESLKNKYDGFVKIYNTQKNDFDDIAKYYEEQKADYEAEVKAAQSRGGVNSEEYDILEEERKNLNKLIESIKQKQAALNKTADDINAVANVINRLIRQLNLTVGDYNSIGEKTADEFQQGQYIRDQAGEKINIYQFDDRPALIRVLAHELGHALNLDHLDNPEAIMYRLNESGQEKITADDLATLKKTCGIK